MEKLNALVGMLRAARLIAAERIDAAVESGETQWAGNTSGAALLLLRVRYTAVVELFGVAGSLKHLLALVEVWLDEHDRDHNRLAGFEGEPVDQERSDVLLRLELEEAVRYVPITANAIAPERITWRGQDWMPGRRAAERAEQLAGVSAANGG